MSYLVVTLALNQPDTYCDILSAELSDLNYEGFEELPAGLKAYITQDLYDADALSELLDWYKDKAGATLLDVSPLPDINWNETWERSFQPIWVGGEQNIFIRAPFHEPQPARYELVVEPKMAFGTGHHETTAMMLQAMLPLDFLGRQVLDFGSGTGILAIMACKLGAASVVAIDNDTWAYQSCIENAELNHTPNVRAVLGTAADIPSNTLFDVILANINRNIILAALPQLEAALQTDGYILFSGILQSDISEIIAATTQYNWHLNDTLQAGQWAMLCFGKKANKIDN